MRRVLPALMALTVVVTLAPLPLAHLSAFAQETVPQVTFEALQTRVAELEEQLGVTPVPEPEESDSAVKAEHTQVTIAGTALDLLPKGESDVLGVIAVGPYAPAWRSPYVPFVIRNNSPDAVAGIDVSLSVRSADGSLLASGHNSWLAPIRLEPGDVAFGVVYLNDVELPRDAVFDFTLDSSRARDPGASGVIDFEVLEINELPDRIVGEVRNGTGQSQDHAKVWMMCFTGAGWPTRTLSEYLDRDTIPPDGTATFQIDSYESSGPCPKYLIAVDWSW